MKKTFKYIALIIIVVILILILSGFHNIREGYSGYIAGMDVSAPDSLN